MRTILILLIALQGCAVMQSPTTFAACKSADIVTTAIGLNSGKFVETNPVLKVLIGPHHFVPLIAFSVGMYVLLRYLNQPKTTETVNAVTCAVAAHNAFLLVH